MDLTVLPWILMAFLLFLVLHALHQIRQVRQRLDALLARQATGQTPPAAEEAKPSPIPVPVPAVPVTPAVSAPPVSSTAAAPEKPATTPARKASLEQTIGSRWMVWLGGLALALAGVFLVRYSIEAGLLGPTARVTLGVLFGLVLVVAAEVLRRKPGFVPAALSGWNHIPAALAAAGSVALFAAVYSGYALYDLYSPLTAFVALAAISMGAQTLALRHGPLMGLLGLVGAFVVPALVSTEKPDLITLLVYLQLVLGASLGLIRWIGVRWLAWAALAGATIWPLLWMGSQPGQMPGEGWPLSLYAVAMMAWFVLVPRPFRALEEDGEGFWPVRSVDWLVVTAGAVTATLLFLLCEYTGYDISALTAAGIFVLAVPVVGRWQQPVRLLAAEAGLLALAVACCWPLPGVIAPAVKPFALLAGLPAAQGLTLIPSDAMQNYMITMLVLAVVWAVGLFRLMYGAVRPWFWSALSVVVPMGLLVILYGRLSDFSPDLQWGILALVLAAWYLLCAHRVQRISAASGMTEALAVYAAGTTAAVALCFALVMRDAWLTVALALEVLALAWIYGRLPVRGLRTLALVMASVVLSRLVLNPWLLEYSGWIWVLYGYGVPALSFWLAWRRFDPARKGEDARSRLLEGGAAVFGIMLAMMLASTAIYGDFHRANYNLLEASSYTALWLATAVALVPVAAVSGRQAPRWLWRILALMGVVNIVLFHVIILNPLAENPAPYMVRWPVLNALFLAYGVPAGLLAALATAVWPHGHRRKAVAMGIGALFLGLLWLSAEVHRAFGGFLPGGVPDSMLQAQSWTLSAVWMVSALAVLGVGIVRHHRLLRQGGLALALVTVLKVFLLDMAELDGLWRVASFLGLGLCLLGIGYAYQRLMVRDGEGQDS
ncbi:MAG: DUF2339 domain-containing protein [Pseudomonadota bacterium]|nr:DUF2339 domain-containing protein [Pseudomonadota bacterium]